MKAIKRTLTATPNYSARTFTLRVKYVDGTTTKYRTTQMNKEEFESNLYNTENDWFQFLKSENYYKVK